MVHARSLLLRLLEGRGAEVGPAEVVVSIRPLGPVLVELRLVGREARMLEREGLLTLLHRVEALP